MEGKVNKPFQELYGAILKAAHGEKILLKKHLKIATGERASWWRKKKFKFLCKEVHPSLYRENTHMKGAISFRRRVAIALLRLDTNSDYRNITAHLGVSQASVCDIADEFCHVIGDILLPRDIKMPIAEGRDENITKFQNK